jgi:predicted DNA-binding transcriptional regulator AlpA
MTKPLPYPPPWIDTVSLAQHICISTSTIENWVSQGILPPPRKRGGKLLWKWAEVDEWLSNGNSQGRTDAENITEAVRREREKDKQR